MSTVLMVTNEITLIMLRVYIFIDVFAGSRFSFYQYKYGKSGQIFHTGPLSQLINESL